MTGQFVEVRDGGFVRQRHHVTDRITADGSSGYPVEAGRSVRPLSAARAAVDDMAERNATAVDDGVYQAGATSQEHDEATYDALFTRLHLFRTPGFGDTTDVDHVKRHYRGTHEKINPTGVLPKGPDLSGWHEPHGRDHLRD